MSRSRVLHKLRRNKRRRWQRRGQAAIIVAIAATLLMSGVALGVDGARFYAEGLHVQKAADEAALAAVAQSGSGSSILVQNTAQEVITRNLILPSGASVVVSTTLATNPVNAVTVTVTEHNFPLLFAPVVGLKSGNITRQSVAQYNAPVPMGNPSSTLGDPTSAITTFLPGGGGVSSVTQNLKLSIDGPDQFTENGDPYSPLYVLSDQPVVTGTPLMKNPFRAATSPQFDGYDYEVTIPSGSQGATYIQVYDAETCVSSSGFGDKLRTNSFGLPYTNEQTQYPVPSVSYGKYPTYYRMYWLNPLTGQRDSVSASPGFTATYPLTSEGNMPADTIIAPTEGYPVMDGQAGPPCETAFQNKWYTLAKVNAANPGSYIINVNTCLASGYDPSAAPYPGPGTLPNRYSESASGNGLPDCEGSEVNNFALRAVTAADESCTGDPQCQTITPNPNSPQPQVSGIGRISTMVSAPGNSVIYLAKIDPIYAGKWLLIKMFDPGDLSGGSSVQVVRPDGSYAPFEWYTQSLDGSGNPFQTTLQNNDSTSLITSFPVSGTIPTPPTSTPTPSQTPTATSTPVSATQTAAAATGAVDTMTAVASATNAAAATNTASAGQTNVANTATAAPSATASAATAQASQTAGAQTVTAGPTATSAAQTTVAGQTQTAGTSTAAASQTAGSQTSTAQTVTAIPTATAAAQTAGVQTSTAAAGQTASTGQTQTAGTATSSASTVQATQTSGAQTITAIPTATAAAQTAGVQTSTAAAGQTASATQTAGVQTSTAAAGQTAAATQTAGSKTSTAVAKTATATAKTATAVAKTATAAPTATAAAQTSTAQTQTAGPTATAGAQTSTAQTQTAGPTATAGAQTATAVASQTAGSQTSTAGTATAAAGQTSTAKTATAVASQTAGSQTSTAQTQTAGPTVTAASKTSTAVASQTAGSQTSTANTATAAAGQTSTAKTATASAGQSATASAGQTSAASTSTAAAGQTVVAQTSTASAGQTSTAVAIQTATASAAQTSSAQQTATASANQTNTAATSVAATQTARPTPTRTPIATDTVSPDSFNPNPGSIGPGGSSPQEMVLGLHLVQPRALPLLQRVDALAASTAVPTDTPTDTPTVDPNATPTAAPTSTPVIAVYSEPPYSNTLPQCPSPDSSVSSQVSPSGSAAYGQTMAEDNPFDPLHLVSAGCFSSSDYHDWSTQSNTPPLPSWLATPVALNTPIAYETYNLYQDPRGVNSNYRPYNGRWVYIFTQIPSDYATNGNNSNSCSTCQWWWYLQYHTVSGQGFTDRTEYEAYILNTPPHLIN